MKRRILLISIVLAIVFDTVGCSTATTVETNESGATEAQVKEQVSMFVCVEHTDNWDIMYHRGTKVMYAVSRGSYNQGTFTVMLDADGNPLLYEE